VPHPRVAAQLFRWVVCTRIRIMPPKGCSSFPESAEYVAQERESADCVGAQALTGPPATQCAAPPSICNTSAQAALDAPTVTATAQPMMHHCFTLIAPRALLPQDHTNVSPPANSSCGSSRGDYRGATAMLSINRALPIRAATRRRIGRSERSCSNRRSSASRNSAYSTEAKPPASNARRKRSSAC